MNKINFGDIEVSKKEFYESKKAVNLKDIDVSTIIVSSKIKGNNETSEPIYDDQYIKTKAKTFSEIIKTLFDGDKIPEERI